MLSRADAALSELSGLGRLLPNRHLLITPPYVRREAVLMPMRLGSAAPDLTAASTIQDGALR